jgi:hypothetical protein
VRRRVRVGVKFRVRDRVRVWIQAWVRVRVRVQVQVRFGEGWDRLLGFRPGLGLGFKIQRNVLEGWH